ncbi:MAG: hypothetical protein K6G26_12590, partial [Lachnospiraceae bacterium]|nr:hypothetical protein [Lachnospiraceae bacterium]
MIYLLDFREKVRGIYSSYKEYCTLAYKFIMSLITFIVIDVKLGFGNEFMNALSVLLLALVGTFIPSSLTVLLACLVSVACVFSYSPVLGFMLTILLIIVYAMFMRFVPKLAYAMLAVPIAYVFKLPVLVPIILGLVCTPIAVIPVICGTIVYYFILAIKSVESVSNSVNKVEALQVFIYVMRKFTENKAIFVSVILFFIITILVYVIRTRNIDHAYEIAIICAGILYLFTYLVAAFNSDLGIGIVGIVLGAIISCAIAIIVQFFICVLDYSSVENVQFEDDD